MKTLALFAAAMTAALATPASAYVDGPCVASALQVICMPRTTNPDAHIIQIPEYHDPDLTDADRAEWTTRCKPRKVFDGLSVRWTYAERGCSAGPMHLE